MQAEKGYRKGGGREKIKRDKGFRHGFWHQVEMSHVTLCISELKTGVGASVCVQRLKERWYRWVCTDIYFSLAPSAEKT